MRIDAGSASARLLFAPRRRLAAMLAVASALSLLFVPLYGCSGGQPPVTPGDQLSKRYGIDRSEFVAIKKAAKNNSGAFKKALNRAKFEKLKEKGLIEEIKPQKSGQQKRSR
jgi:hypothetical protein